jgi:hypothetical protein
MPSAKKRTVYKSAETGRFVPKDYAKKHKSTTFGERVKVPRRGKGK